MSAGRLRQASFLSASPDAACLSERRGDRRFEMTATLSRRRAAGGRVPARHPRRDLPPRGAAVLTQPRAGDGFRPDIQGLRGVAVLIVALDHAGVPGMGGGYVGVDVFFVISGFLITGWLLGRALDSARVPFGDFYAARARRILPAAVPRTFTSLTSARTTSRGTTRRRRSSTSGRSPSKSSSTSDGLSFWPRRWRSCASVGPAAASRAAGSPAWLRWESPRR